MGSCPWACSRVTARPQTRRDGSRSELPPPTLTLELAVLGTKKQTRFVIPEPRPNLTILTARHYSRVEDQSERPRPVPADVIKASADELRAVWGPFVGEAGTYEVTTDNRVTMRPIAAKNPAVMGPGVFITYSYKLDGNTMWVTQQRNQNGPSPIQSRSRSCASNDSVVEASAESSRRWANIGGGRSARCLDARPVEPVSVVVIHASD